MVTVRYYAGARAAAGVSEEPARALTLGRLRTELGDRHGPRLAAVLAVATFLSDGRALPGDADTDLPDGATIEVLPPFAGG